MPMGRAPSGCSIAGVEVDRRGQAGVTRDDFEPSGGDRDDSRGRDGAERPEPRGARAELSEIINVRRR